MYHIRDDQRSIRSAEMLYDGLKTLVQRIPFDNIKIKDLVEESGVGRATFYRHFDTIEDVLRRKSDQVFEEMIQHIIAFVEENGNDLRLMLLKPVLRYFNSHSEIIELLLQADRLDIAMASFRRAVEPYKEHALTYLDIDPAYIDYSITVRVAIVTNILVQWIETGKSEPPDELADLLSVMIKNMVTLDQLI